jgi:ABC-type multidrug transport system permease subunit
MWKPYLAYTWTTLRLTGRDRLVLFFNYLMPLIFFFAFGEGFGGRTSAGSLKQVVTMVLMLGVLGSGFFGGGLRATAEREAGILRRFKVAPITPAPILVASIITGWLVFLPTVVFFFVLARIRYGLEFPTNAISLLAMVSLGIMAFRSVGLIVASVVNSMQESQIIIQLLYLPMLMLCGATVPLSIMPEWLQTAAQFLPATHLYLGMTGILVRGESLLDNAAPAFAMILTIAVSLFISMKLFRWEKEEKLKPAAKLWVAAVLAPFLLLGLWQTYSKSNLRRAEILARGMRRDQTWLVRGARLFIGDGTVVESGGLLIKRGKIQQVYAGPAPDPKSLDAELIEAGGKTAIPGLIDASVELMLDGAPRVNVDGQTIVRRMERSLASYLYCGVIAVGSRPAPGGAAEKLSERVRAGEIQGAEPFLNPAAASVEPLPLLAGQLRSGNYDYYKSSLYLQVTPEPLRLELDRWVAAKVPPASVESGIPGSGVLATRSGTPLLPHGPAIHREMELRVRAGRSPSEVLQGATSRAAALLGASNRIGFLKPGFDASFILVEGNPLDDITVTQRLAYVMFLGEHVSREALLEQQQRLDKELDKETAPAAPKKSLGSGK